MSAARKVAVIVGSLRHASNSERLAKAIAAESPANLVFDIVPIGDLPFYNPDIDGPESAGNGAPQQWRTFRDRVRSADAVLFVTPEYNRSVPAVLKNAIDVGSRPYGQSVYDGKPAAVVSSSIGPIGGFGANHHLRQSLAFLNMPTLQQPEMYLGSVGDWFDEAGAVKNADTRAFLASFGKKFAAWIETTAPVKLAADKAA